MPCAAKMSHLKILQGTGNDKRVSSRKAPKNDTTNSNSGVADYSCVRLFLFFFSQFPKLKIVILVRKENSEEVKKEREGQIFLGDRSLRKIRLFCSATLANHSFPTSKLSPASWG